MVTATRIPLAPGARVVIRDEEWIVRRVDPSSDGGDLLVCDGVSEVVRGRTAQFLTVLEDDRIEVLDPAETTLVADTSPHFNAGLLHIEAMLRRNLPNDDRIRLGHRAVMDVVPYQLDPALQALRQPRQRILIADATGLGKTLEAGILTTELVQRGRGTRILVVTLKSMLTQFQKEFWTRFSIPLVRLDSVGLAAVRNRIPANHNPFNYYDRTIISIDSLKNNLEYRNYLEQAWWDLIIIDECHNVAARATDSGLSRRARLARLLAGRSDALVLLSATPHDGSARSFASLVTLLDPTAISDPEDYTPEDYRDKGLVIRRFKKDIRDQVRQQFEDRETTVLRARASAEEDAAFEALLAVPFTHGGHRTAGRQHELLRLSLQKALFSSPAAAAQSTRNRMASLEQRELVTNETRAEHAALAELLEKVDAITPACFSRWQRLLQLLRDPSYGWSAQQDDDRVVIFSERLDTLAWLREELGRALKLRADDSDTSQVAVLHGELPDTAQMALVERFGRQTDPLRILLCSDVASEGLNLHHFCHRLVHFDLPWSLMVFQQRNGRIDRYGQTRKPLISYLLTSTDVERIKGDLRILEVLQRKDDRANQDLGDPSAFMHLCDPDAEAKKVAEVMAAGTDAEAFDRELERDAATTTEGEGDWLLNLFNAPPEATTSSALDAISEAPSLFPDDYGFAKAALEELGRGKAIAQWSHHDASRTLTVTAPADLQARLRQIPREARDADDRYVLTVERAHVAEAIERARQAKSAEESWPDLQYLWPQHPISEWLRDRVLVHFGRHTAPVLRSPHLAEGERALLMLALIPNRKGQPMVVEWRAVVLHASHSTASLEDFGTFVARAGLKAGALPNPNSSLDTLGLQADLRVAVARMQQHMAERQAGFAREMEARLSSTLARLEELQGRQLLQLQLRFEEMGGPENLRRGQKARREGEIHRVFDDYKKWVEDSLETEPHPHLQVLAAVCR
ncbi:MAG: DEAD/DEAH box helicase [Acidobacteria bacterium]|nr:DEAD/DEAH box helicase [Acidobacteriota bacterium]